MTTYRPLPTRRRRRGGGGAAVIAVVIVALISLGVFLVIRGAYSASEREVVTVVTSKERVCDGGEQGGCKYLIFTEAGTFKVTDSFGLLGGPTRFSSSDLFGRIEEGPATLTVIGWRLPLLSQYPNLVSYEGAPE